MPAGTKETPGSQDSRMSRSWLSGAPSSGPVAQLSSEVSEKRTASVAFSPEAAVDSSTATPTRPSLQPWYPPTAPPLKASSSGL